MRVQTHLVMSRTAEITFAYETTSRLRRQALAHTTHSIDDMRSDLERSFDDGDDRRALFDAFDVGNLIRPDNDIVDPPADVT